LRIFRIKLFVLDIKHSINNCTGMRAELFKANRSRDNSNSFNNLSFELFVLWFVETTKILTKESKTLLKIGSESLLSSFSQGSKSSNSIFLDN
jgi:hypothetical protein